MNSTELLRKAKQHPLVKRYIDGGKTVSFTAQMIPRGGIKTMPKLYGNGFLAAGDAASMTSGRRGMDIAMMTGRLAAETATLAKAEGDFSVKSLSSYQHKLSNTFFIQNMKRSPNITAYLKANPEIDFLMSRTVNRLAGEYFSVGVESDTEKIGKMARIVKDIQPPLKTVQDLYNALKNWSV